MKYPPHEDKLWSKPGVTVKGMYADLQACGDEGLKSGITLARDRMIYAEACMLKKGFTFTDYRSSNHTDYCNKDWYGGGPACRSVGR